MVSITGERPRVQAGIPTGGQFTASAHGESEVALEDSAPAVPSIVDADTVFTQKYDSVEEKIAALQAELVDKVSDLATDEGWREYLESQKRFHHYSLTNQMLISLQTQGRATRVAGFRVWQSMGRQVRKGEKGIAVLAPKKIRKTETDANGKPVKGPDGKPIKRMMLIGFTTATVFDVSQTDGDPLPDGGDRTLTDTPPDGLREDLETAVAATGYRVEYRTELPGGSEGYTDGVNKLVVIDSKAVAGNQVSTLAHELGHIMAGHMERTGEYHTGHGGQRGAMEIEAESIASVLCGLNGLRTKEDFGRYVAGWGSTDPEQVRKSGEVVQKTVKAILASNNFRNLEEGVGPMPSAAQSSTAQHAAEAAAP
ncbi:MAG: ArdC-like ssDNA-binding domain-containing protein [Nakamurella sp.]